MSHFPLMGEVAVAIGHRIALAREKAGLSQRALGRAIGHASGSTVCHYEAGRRVPTVKAIYALAVILGVRPGSLLP